MIDINMFHSKNKNVKIIQSCNFQLKSHDKSERPDNLGLIFIASLKAEDAPKKTFYTVGYCDSIQDARDSQCKIFRSYSKQKNAEYAYHGSFERIAKEALLAPVNWKKIGSLQCIPQKKMNKK